MKLTKVTVYKYKSFLQEQSVTIEPDITRLVGKNESGKTAFLETLYKFNYFEEPKKEFNFTDDFPRSIKKEQGKPDSKVVSCEFILDDILLERIETDLGKGVVNPEITVITDYNNAKTYIIQEKFNAFLLKLVEQFHIEKSHSDIILTYQTIEDIINYCTSKTELQSVLERVKAIQSKKSGHSNAFLGYIISQYVTPNLPKFWYYDEYYEMPGEFNINCFTGSANGLTPEKLSVVKALLELAEIDYKLLQDESKYEAFKSELEATSNQITDKMFEYWTTNKNLEIQIEIKHYDNSNKYVVIRVKNNKHRVTLPLQNRSRGFNWFFSFLVWFSKIQKKTDNTYILLLDEPGLNLHASAQADLLNFIETELAVKYQIIYTTHSPFMVDNSKLNQVRTVYDAPDEKTGSIISDVIQEKDPDTLFPLQAALGYDIAQNLFIAPKNVLVEGVSDLMYLTAISELLMKSKKTYLAEDICLVPVGGMDKVATFISLLRGQKLDIVCLLDVSKVGQQRLKDMVAQKIIHDKKIIYFDKFAKGAIDLEDMFSIDEYLALFNSAFAGKYPIINKKDIDPTKPILGQINRLLKVDRFNHYLPANEFLKIADKDTFLSEATKTQFSQIFEEINKLFQ